MDEQQLQVMRSRRGFIAALDQSLASLPRALAAYGIAPERYSSQEQMLALAWEMRERILRSRALTAEHVLAVILSEDAIAERVDGLDAGAFLWKSKRLVPFLKIDRGLTEADGGVRLMRLIDDLDALLELARRHHALGTKARSLVLDADDAGIERAVAQQLHLAREVIAAGLLPIVEPEVDIRSPRKAEAEALLLGHLRAGLDSLGQHEQVVLKLTLPEVPGLWAPLVLHPRVVRVAALSGGYSQAESTARLARNPGVVASFSRALTEGLAESQPEAEFERALEDSVRAIFEASVTP